MNNPKSEVPVHKSDLPFGEIFCATAEETFAFGERFGAALTGGEVVLLDGELGAGKTLFVKGVMSALEFDVDEVTSPSFALVNIYEARLKVFHLDLFRLNAGAPAAYAVDLDEILQDENCAVFIEWAKRLQDFPLPKNAIRISIEGDGDAPRRITVQKNNGGNVQAI